ncbi:MAG: hypothetical protein ACTSQE_12555 [Candidatus Heimdallarchaeaceae archaeon]
MPYKKQLFTKKYDNLQDLIDVDDSRGRSVPINMNFIEEGYLTKDTGYQFFSDEDLLQRYSLFHYKKEDGTSFIISAYDTKLQKWDGAAWVDLTADIWTIDTEFSFYVYNNELWGSNGVDDYFKFNGTAITKYATAPKGTSLEVFEDRMFVTGVSTAPGTYYYSNIGAPQTFTVTDLVKPLGTDKAMTMKNYHGTLLMFKEKSIWKLSFQYDQIVSLFVPKITLQSNTYGVASKDSVVWAENDLWFFTGSEVRAIGFVDNQAGVFGVNQAVISEQIKETLKNIDISNYSKIRTFYLDRKYYLSVPIGEDTNNVLFVCHLLYRQRWTKYTGRMKSLINSFLEIDGEMHTNTNVEPFRIIKWDDSLNDDVTAISSEVFFRRIEDKLFNRFVTYRYIDLKLKDIVSTIRLIIKAEASDTTTSIIKDTYIGFVTEDMENSLGEVPVAQVLVADSFGETIQNSPFVKKRGSFLSKSQALIIGLANDRLNETFTISEFILLGYEERRKTFSGSKIISMK